MIGYLFILYFVLVLFGFGIKTKRVRFGGRTVPMPPEHLRPKKSIL
jgi:hypothetical protein